MQQLLTWSFHQHRLHHHTNKTHHSIPGRPHWRRVMKPKHPCHSTTVEGFLQMVTEPSSVCCLQSSSSSRPPVRQEVRDCKFCRTTTTAGTHRMCNENKPGISGAPRSPVAVRFLQNATIWLMEGRWVVDVCANKLWGDAGMRKRSTWSFDALKGVANVSTTTRMGE